MELSVSAFSKLGLVRMAYRPIQSLIHNARRKVNPGVPLGHKVIDVSCLGRKMSIEVRRWNLSDQMAVEQCFRDQQYDMPTGAQAAYLDRIYREIVDSGRQPLIIDCGANIGASVLWFSARYPEAHIIAVEPAPANFALLSANCRGVDAELKQAGVGPVDGTAWVEDQGNESGMGCRTNEHGEGIHIEIVSLQTLMASKPATTYAPFLLKVDIEGAEKSLFTGPASVFDQFPVIIMEPHDWMFPGRRTSVEFFRYHAQAGREFAMKHENVASIAHDPRMLDTGGTVPADARH